MRADGALVVMLAIIALCGASPHHPHAVSHAAPARARAMLTSADVLTEYTLALTRFTPPPAQIFEYSVEQAGSHGLAQSHRVYRTALNERDETLSIDGRRLPRPAVRISRGRPDHYDLLAVAPRPGPYTFIYARVQFVGGRREFVFRTESQTGGAFAVDSIAIETETFLPTTIRFHVTTGTTKASGQLTFGRSERYWVIHEASVTARSGKATARERIRWGAYQFPPTLPPSTFAWRGDGGQASHSVIPPSL